MTERNLTDAEAATLRDILTAARAAARDGGWPGRGWMLDNLGHRLEKLPAELLAKLEP